MIAPSRRLILSCLLLLVASVLVSLWGLGTGLVPLSVEQVISALLGDAPRNVAMVVTEWRLPRVLMALLIGAALGVSGTLRASFAPYNTQDDVYALVHAVDRALEILVD